MSVEFVLLAAVLTLIIMAMVIARRAAKRLAFIKSFQFPESVKQKVAQTYPHLASDQLDLVMETLRSFFLISYKAKASMVAMPSQVVDVAWHQFILFTRNYDNFCRKGFGRFLHHTPSEAMKSKTKAQEGIKRAWRLACHLDKVDPKQPQSLPMLFAIDALLNIEDGFFYALNCKERKSPYYGDNYCASHIGCSSGCSGSSGSCSSSDSSGCSSGCGGD